MPEGAIQKQHRLEAELKKRNREPLGARGWLLLLACILIGPILLTLAALAPELLIAPFR